MSRALRVLFLVTGDVFAIIAAFYSAYLLKFKLGFALKDIMPIPQKMLYQNVEVAPFFEHILLMCSVYTLCLLAMDCYKRYSGILASIEQWISVLKAISLASVILISINFVFELIPSSRYVFAYAWLCGVFYCQIIRFIADKLLNLQSKRAEACCVIGGGKNAQQLVERITLYKAQSLSYKGSIYKGQPKNILFSIQTTFKQLGDSIESSVMQKYFNEEKIKHVFIAHSTFSTEALHELISLCKKQGISVYIHTPVPASLKGVSESLDFDGMPLVAYVQKDKRFIYHWIKRALDIVFSMVLIVLLSPLFIVIGAWIKIVSPAGHIIFTQQRCGYKNSVFNMYKFRTMYKDAEKVSGPKWVSKDDNRYIFGGKFLRKFSIDELPQLINVLLNDMSFIGPRPERPEIIEKISKDVPYFTLRHEIKGGITGWAQIHGRAFLTNKPAEKCRYDLYYIKHLSFALDIKIFLKTILVVLKGEQAY